MIDGSHNPSFKGADETEEARNAQEAQQLEELEQSKHAGKLRE